LAIWGRSPQATKWLTQKMRSSRKRAPRPTTDNYEGFGSFAVTDED
jgi:hypothetical protein